MRLTRVEKFLLAAAAGIITIASGGVVLPHGPVADRPAADPALTLVIVDNAADGLPIGDCPGMTRGRSHPSDAAMSS